MYKSHNTFRQYNDYSYAYSKEIKEGFNDPTNLDELSLTCSTRYQLEINNKNNLRFKNTNNQIRIGYNSYCTFGKYYQTLFIRL